jgi:TIR domain
MAKVFVSHASADRVQADQLIKALEDFGHDVWWDDLLTGGDDYKEIITDHLSSTDVVIVMWTKASKKSVWVKKEASVCRSRLVSVHYDRALKPPEEFEAIHAEDLSGWDGIKPRAKPIEKLSNRIFEMKRQFDLENLALKLNLTPSQQKLLKLIFNSAMPGGLRIASFVLGVLASGVALWLLLFAVNIFVGSPDTTPGLVWLVLLLLGMASARGMDQLIQIANDKMEDRFYDKPFSFSCAICGMLGVVVAFGLVLQTHLTGGVSVDDASGTLQFAVGVGMALLVTSYFVRILFSVGKLLGGRVSDASAG